MFIAAGVVGVVLLVLFLVADDVLDGLVPDAGWISGPAIAAFLAAFGLGGWVAQAGFDAPTGVAALVGVASGLGLGWIAYRLSRALMDSPTDETPRTATLVGRGGRVVTSVTAGHVGEVLVRLGGQPVKLSATAGESLPVGTDVVVIAVESDTRVVVESADRFWAPGDQPTAD